MPHLSYQSKVSYPAQEFNMTKATISDAVKVLEQKKFLKKENQVKDTRSYVLHLTATGKKITREISLFANPMRHALLEFTNEEKENFLHGLSHLIYNLHQEKTITIQRMCFTCRHYQGDKTRKHYCQLMQIPLKKMNYGLIVQNMNMLFDSN